jgi:AraC family transcriptional regulator
MHLPQPLPATGLGRPNSVSRYEVEHALSANGIHAEIRSFGWDRSIDGEFELQSHYIDYALLPRLPGARLFYDNGRPTPPTGDIVFLPRGSRLVTHCDPSEHRLLCLTFDPPSMHRLFEARGQRIDLSPCFDVRAPRVRQVFARLAEEVREPGFAHDILLESLVLTLVVELCRHLRARNDTEAYPRGQIAGWRLKRLQQKVEACLSEQLSVTDLAAECGMSPRHLIRTFKNSTGMTLSDYIASVRVDRARTALLRDDQPIKAVAFDCGFQSAAAFSASFRKATGMTPSAYRQERHRRAG